MTVKHLQFALNSIVQGKAVALSWTDNKFNNEGFESFPDICIFDIDAWTNQDPHAQKRPIKVFKGENIPLNPENYGFNEGMAIGNSVALGGQNALPIHVIKYDENKPDTIQVSYLKDESAKTSSSGFTALFKDISIVQETFEGDSLTLKEGSNIVVNLQEAVVNELKNRRQITKIANKVEGLGNRKVAVIGSKIQDQNGMVLFITTLESTPDKEPAMQLLLKVDFDVFRVQVLTSFDLNNKWNALRQVGQAQSDRPVFAQDLPDIVQGDVEEEILFFERVPYSFDLAKGKFSFASIFAELPSSSRGIEDFFDMSASFVDLTLPMGEGEELNLVSTQTHLTEDLEMMICLNGDVGSFSTIDFEQEGVDIQAKIDEAFKCVRGYAGIVDCSGQVPVIKDLFFEDDVFTFSSGLDAFKLYKEGEELLCRPVKD